MNAELDVMFNFMKLEIWRNTNLIHYLGRSDIILTNNMFDKIYLDMISVGAIPNTLPAVRLSQKSSNLSWPV